MPRLSLRLLGAPRFAADGQEISPSASRTVPVFALLACNGERLPRERVAELLWRRVEQSSALSSLRQLLHHLPDPLREAIASERTTVGLSRERIDCDLWRLRAALGNGCAAADLLPLYPSPLLGEARFDEFPEFDDWLRSERLRLAADVRRVVEREIATLPPDEAVALAERWLRLDPADEETHARVMALHLAAGRTHAAEAQFEALRQRLATKEGRSPQPATRALLDSAIRKRGSPRGSLPAVATSFVGRQDELAELARLAADPHCRLVTLHGPGGVGKTRLAMAFAEEHARAHESAVFVSLEAAQTAQALYGAVAAVLQLELAPRKDPRNAVCEALRPHRGFLVLDNFEQLLPAESAAPLEAATFVAELLRQAPNVKVLVTSRVSLGLQEEWLVPVSGLPYPDATSENGVHDAGFELFVSRARQAYRGFSASAERPHILAICRAAEGLPLALELAAAQVATRPCAEIAQALLEPTPGRRAVNRPDRQASVLRVIEQSLAAASPAQAEAFAKLSLFQGTFTPAQSFAVARVSEGELAELAARALLGRDARGFRMHPLLRQVALKRLQRQRTLCRRVEAHFIVDTARRAAAERDDLAGPQSRRAHGRLAEHRDDDLLALRLAAAHGEEEDTWTLATAVFHFALASGLVRAALESYPDPEAPGLTPRMRAILRVRRGDLLRHAGQFDLSTADYDAAASSGDKRVLFAVHAGRAGLEIFKGGYARCVRHCEEAKALDPASATEAAHVQLLALEGTAHAELGDFARAKAVLDESMARAEAIHASAMILVHPLNALGGLAEYMGDSLACAEIHRRAIALLDADGITRMQAPHWCNIGGALLGIEDYAGAKPAFEKGIEISNITGDMGPLTYSQIGLANALLGLGQHGEADRVSADAQANARRLQSQALLSEATTARARATLARGELDAARKVLVEHQSSPREPDAGFRRLDEVDTMMRAVQALAPHGWEAPVACALATLLAHGALQPKQRSAIEAWAARTRVVPGKAGDLEEIAARLLALLEG